MSYESNWKSVPGRGSSKYRGSEAGSIPMFLKSTKEPMVAAE